MNLLNENAVSAIVERIVLDNWDSALYGQFTPCISEIRVRVNEYEGLIDKEDVASRLLEIDSTTDDWEITAALETLKKMAVMTVKERLELNLAIISGQVRVMKYRLAGCQDSEGCVVIGEDFGRGGMLTVRESMNG